MRRVRDEGVELDLPFRCDSPDARREMRLRIGARSAGRFVLFSASMLSEVPRRFPQTLLSAEAPRATEKLVMCGWCDRFLVDEEWVEVEEAARRLELFRRPKLPTIGHGICPECTRLLMAA